MLPNWNRTIVVITAVLHLNLISLADAGGSFEVCDEREGQGNCQEFDLSDYEQGVSHPFSFTPRSGYRNSENLEECTYIGFTDEDGTILCSLSHAFDFVIRDTKFFSRDIAAFQWGQLRYCHAQYGSKRGSEKDGSNRQLSANQMARHLRQPNYRSVRRGGGAHVTTSTQA